MFVYVDHLHEVWCRLLPLWRESFDGTSFADVITNRLRLLRADRRWSQSAVAKRLGHNTKFRYWQIENEEVFPTDDERHKLAAMFDVPDEFIFPPPVVVPPRRPLSTVAPQ